MAAKPIISVSGLRGIVGESLDPPQIARYVAAYAAQQPPGPIVVTRDGRSTGEMVQRAVESALLAMGRSILIGDIAATPTTGILVDHHQAAGAIQISASHNPPQYNGLKLFGTDARVLTAEKGEQVLERFEANDIPWADYQSLGSSSCIEDAIGPHLDRLLKICDVEAIRAASIKVVLDSNHGAGSILGRRLLDELGCSVSILGDTPDGQFAHPPEPTADNLTSVGQNIVESQASVGFCQDPDADRLALIDETGCYIGEEYTLAICMKHILESRKGPVVTNCATSRMSQDLADSFGVPYVRASVGEANVVDKMLENEAVFGGEGNGGPIDPTVGFVRDSFVGMTLVLDAMVKSGKRLSELVAELPKYEIRKTKVSIERSRIPDGIARLEAQNPDADADRSDGLRLDWPGRWLLVRASNTEPIVRVIAEAETGADAEALCTMASEILA